MPQYKTNRIAFLPKLSGCLVILPFLYLGIISSPSLSSSPIELKLSQGINSKVKNLYNQTLGTGERLSKNLSLSESEKQQLATSIFTTFQEEERFNSLVFFFRYALLEGFDPLLNAAKEAYLLGRNSEGDKYVYYLSELIKILDFIFSNFRQSVDESADKQNLNSKEALSKALVDIEQAIDLSFIVTEHLEKSKIHQIKEWNALELNSVYYQYFSSHYDLVEILLSYYELIFLYSEVGDPELTNTFLLSAQNKKLKEWRLKRPTMPKNFLSPSILSLTESFIASQRKENF